MRSSGPNSPPPINRLTPKDSTSVRPPSNEGDGGGTGASSKATLSRELSDLLVELSIAMQKHAIYPPGHPLLDVAVDGVVNKLAHLLVNRSSLSLGIARRQLIIEGVGTDPEHPLLKELAGRLHKHGLGAIKITKGFARDELADALATIAVDPSRIARPLGDVAGTLSERWHHIRLYPLNYERLQLLYEGTDESEDRLRRPGSTKAAQLWVGMARAAMMLDDESEVDDKSLNPLAVAEAIDKRPQEQAYDQVIVGYLLQIAEELKRTGGQPESIELQKRISELVKQLSPASLQKLLQMGGDRAQRRQFLLNASQGMTVDAVVDLVQAASTEERQTISHSMMRLFSKLSRFAENDPDRARRANADASAREHISKMIAEWNLDDPNPTAYGKVLQQMALSGGSATTGSYTDIEPERILQMGFELSVSGPRFDAALDSMLNSARFDVLLALLDGAPDPEFAAATWAYLDSHDILWAVLGEARIDFAVLERIVARKRLSAVEPILDVVDRTADPKVRERLLDTLQPLGDEVGPFIAHRLDTSRAEQRRDLFLFLGKLKNIPDGIDVARYLLHQDPAVRREAIRLMLKFVETREQAFMAALSETDERAVFYALTAAQETGCPPRAMALVRQRIDAGDLDSSLMTLAIRVLAAADSTPAPVLTGRGRTSQMMRAFNVKEPGSGASAASKTLEWLIGRVAHKTRFLRRWQLQPKTPEMLAALGALAAYWNTEEEVQEIIALATRTGDPDFRKAMGAQRVTGKFKAIAD